MEEKRNNFSEIGVALARHFESLYLVDVETGQYSEYVHKGELDEFQIPVTGEDFFKDVRKNAFKCVHPDDLELIVKFHDRDNILKVLSERESYAIVYRLVIDGRIEYVRNVQMMCEDKKHVIFCLENVEEEMKEKNAKDLDLQSAKRMARLDELTGIRNKNAFMEYIADIDAKLKMGTSSEPFGIVMCDVNDLKRINDTRGHSFGDEVIQRTSRIICGIYKHSPVFRVGGDEFVAVITQDDYRNRESLLKQLRDESFANKRSRSGPVIACGMAIYEPGQDTSFDMVFGRADKLMYENKSELKAMQLLADFSNMKNKDIPIPEERKRKLDALFGALLTVSGGGYVYLNDMKYDLSRWSIALIDDFNMDSEYMYHADSIWQGYVHPDDIGVYKDAVDAVLCGTAEVKSIYYRVRKPDGNYILLTTRGFVLSDEDGNPEYFGGIMLKQ